LNGGDGATDADRIYDTGERLYQIKNGATTIAQYGYDPLSRLQSVSLVDTSSIARTYEPDDDLSTLTHTYTGGSLAFSYTSNGAGQLKTISTATTGQLVGPPAAPSSYTPNSLNQYSAVAGNPATFDANGNLAGDGLWIYRYDEENRLRQALKPGTTVDYAYDPQGRRRSKTVNGVVTNFISDGPNELAELNSTGVRQRFYVNGLGMDERVALWDDAGGTGWTVYHGNHQGSVVLTTLGSSGGGIGTLIDYGPYGESTAALAGNPIRYTGRYLDAETGLYFYRARYYSTSLGRFLQTDPIGVKDDLNLYAYVYNDAVNRADPSGNCPWCAVAGAIAGAAYEAGRQAYVSYKATGSPAITDKGAVFGAAVKGGFIGLTGGAAGELAAFSGAGKLAQIATGAGAAALGNSVISPLVDAAGGLQNVGSPGHYAAESAGTAAGYIAGGTVGDVTSTTTDALVKASQKTGFGTALTQSKSAQVAAVAGKEILSNMADAAAANKTQGALEPAGPAGGKCVKSNTSSTCQ
jgi:RHS repeat-associated protein